MPLRPQAGTLLFTLVSASAALSMWFYVDRILIGHQLADAAQHERPRGNLSDLYPRWLGARELLLHRRNPYSEDITLEIQKGYYGRVLDPARPNDPKDRQGFAYPAYVVFLLAPLVGFPFDGVRIFFQWLLIAVTLTSVWLWLRVLPWRLPPAALASCMLLTLGSLPAVQGIKMQQLSLLVAGLLAASVACVAMDFLYLSGALLALATIKPQLAWLVVAWLLLWAASAWRARRKLVYGFGSVLTLLLIGAEILLPGWWRMFAQAISQYHQYTQSRSVLDELLPWAYAGKMAAAGALVLCAVPLLKLRSRAVESAAFGRSLALVLALTVLVVPMFAPYNQVLLVPAILSLVRDRARFNSGSRMSYFLYVAGFLILAWQWFASAGLSAAYLLVSPAWAEGKWQLPFLTTFVVPVIIFGLNLLNLLQNQETEPAPARG